MSEKKSLLVDKSKMPLAMGLAFVAFTTQFGGGFASGAQIYRERFKFCVNRKN